MEIIKKKKDTRKSWEKVVVDGDTLDKRREQRQDQLERYVGERDPDQGPGVLGAVTQWDKEGGTRVVPASQSVLNDLDDDDRRKANLKNPFSQRLKQVNIAHELGKDLDPIVKRTPQERLDSMVVRLKAADPAHVEGILAEIAGEYWRRGMPVSTEDLKTVAAHFLNVAERKQ